jgi:hypothetical protein
VNDDLSLKNARHVIQRVVELSPVLRAINDHILPHVNNRATGSRDARKVPPLTGWHPTYQKL